MTKIKFTIFINYINNLGVPARKLAVGLSAHSPRHTRFARMPAGYPLQSLTQMHSFSYDFQKIVRY